MSERPSARAVSGLSLGLFLGLLAGWLAGLLRVPKQHSVGGSS